MRIHEGAFTDLVLTLQRFTLDSMRDRGESCGEGRAKGESCGEGRAQGGCAETAMGDGNKWNLCAGSDTAQRHPLLPCSAYCWSNGIAFMEESFDGEDIHVSR